MNDATSEWVAAIPVPCGSGTWRQSPDGFRNWNQGPRGSCDGGAEVEEAGGVAERHIEIVVRANLTIEHQSGILADRMSQDHYRSAGEAGINEANWRGDRLSRNMLNNS